jgi:hypothetical protein
MAITKEEKQELIEAIDEGKLPETEEGVVLHNLHKPEPYIKAKFIKEHEVYIKDFFPGESRLKDKGLWANNLHYKGIGTTNDLETWDIISEFGCMDNLGGLKVSGSLLGLSFIVKNRNLRTLNDSYTRIVIGFNPEDVCSLDGSLDYAITLNTKNKVTEATMDTTIIIHDGIGLFQNRSFVINPNIDFRVTTFSALSPVPNLNLSRPLQELLV